MDAARVSRRLGAEVTILYRRRIEDMPSDPEEIEGCEQEGIHIITQAIPTNVIVDANNVVTGIEYLKAKMVSDEKGGRPKPEPIEGSEMVINVTAVIGAIGQEGAFEFLGTEWLEKLNIKKGRIVVDENMQSSIPKLFAGGDSVNATADAISAIADGHKAAKGIDKLLQGL
jgi:glutamate synthase (NADPH/NADH) small chain